MKTLFRTFLFFAVLFSIIYFSGNYFLKKAAARAIIELQPRLEQKGIMIENFDYSTIRLTSYNSFALYNIDLDFHLTRKVFGRESFKAQFDAEKISVRFADYGNPSFFFTFHAFSLFIEPDEDAPRKPFGKLQDGFVQSRIPLLLESPEASAREILAGVRTLFHENKTPLDLAIATDALLGIDDQEIKAHLYTVREDNQTKLRFEKEDILNAAAQFDVELAEEEAAIICEHPSKVPAMIKITRDAKRLSKREKANSSEFPEDAFRHLYWSYHLARQLGPDLAKEITDAHETIPGNTPQEREMDYHNNAVGIDLARKSLSTDELMSLAQNSVEVIRSPNDIL